MTDDSQWLRNLRRSLHRIPEPAFHETATSELVRATLRELGFDEPRSLAGTGLVLDVGSGHGPCLALRADMDALPITERPTSHNLTYRSATGGFMHACGHDCHTAVLLGLARTRADADKRRRLRGTLRLVFQPAEESGGGATRMIEDGALDAPSPDVMVALHVSPFLEVGHLGLARGPAYAACDRFFITVRGVGGHGSQPQAVADPIVAAAHLITQLQTVVARNVAPLDAAVVSVGRVTGGTSFNIIPETVEIEGTVRTLVPAVRDLVERRLREMVAALPAAFALPGASLEYLRETPCGHNDVALANDLAGLAASLVGSDHVHDVPPSLGAEDFAFYTHEADGSPRARAPRAALVRLGCRAPAGGPGWDGDSPAGLHSPAFDVDESCLDVGVAFLSAVVDHVLGGPDASNRGTLSGEDGRGP